MNKAILIGRLTQDPELRYTTSGTPVANFTLAVDRDFTNREGERETDFVNIVVWRKLGEVCANHLTKGRLVAVEGRLQIRSYDDSQGTRRKAAEIVASNVKFLDFPKDKKNENKKNETVRDTAATAANDEDFSGFGAEINFNDDEIPF